MYFYHVEILHFMKIQLGIIKFKVDSCHKTVKTMHFHFWIYFGRTVFPTEWKPRSDVSMKGRTANHNYSITKKTRSRHQGRSARSRP